MKKVLSIVLIFALVFTFMPLNREAKAEDSIDTIIANMTLREKIGQMIMPDFRNWKTEGSSSEVAFTSMNEEVANIMREYHFGGIILFAENVQETEQTTRLTHEIQQVAIDNGDLPYIISVDQEGGKVTRLGTGTSLPGNMALGEIGRAHV